MFCGILISNDIMAQSGSRKREHRNQRSAARGMFKGHSAGNSDNFVRGGIRRSSVNNAAWSMRHSKPGSYKSSDSRTLFSRSRTKGKVYRHNVLAKQNSERAKKRIRGNKVFQHKKFF